MQNRCIGPIIISKKQKWDECHTGHSTGSAGFIGSVCGYTGNESTMLVAKKICAIVIVLNTRCYRMLAVLDDHRDYYNFHNWDHVKYAESPGCSGIRAGNGQELRHAADLALAIDIPLCCCSDA